MILISMGVIALVSLLAVIYLSNNSQFYLQLNPAFWMNQHVHFSMQEKSENSQLQSQILMGSSSILNRNETPAIFPTDNGIYTVSWIQFHDYTKQGFKEEKRIIRTDLSGNVLWSFKLENEFHNWEYRTIFVKTFLTDQKENLYIYGSTKQIRFLYGYKIPNDTNVFVLKMSPSGSIQWVHFYSSQWKDKEMFIHEDKIYLAGLGDTNDFTMMTLNTETGNMIEEKNDMIHLKEENSPHRTNSKLSYYCSEFGIHFVFSKLWIPNDGNVKINVYTFSYEGEFLWNQEISHRFPFESSNPTRVEEIHIASNSSNLFISGCLFRDSKNNPIAPINSFIYALSQQGSIIWKYIPEVGEQKAILSLTCNEEYVFLLGDHFISDSTESSLESNQGRVLYLQALASTDGKQNWVQHFQHTIQAPYYQFASDWDQHFGVYHGVIMQMKENGIVLVSTTKSKNIAVEKGQPGIFEESIPENVANPSEQSCYSVLMELDLYGNIIFNTYTTTDATKEQLLETPSSSVNVYQEFFLSEWIYDMKVWQNKIVTLGATNNTQTALYKSEFRSASLENLFKTNKHLYRNGTFIGKKYFFLLSIYDCSAQ